MNHFVKVVFMSKIFIVETLFCIDVVINVVTFYLNKEALVDEHWALTEHRLINWDLRAP